MHAYPSKNACHRVEWCLSRTRNTAQNWGRAGLIPVLFFCSPAVMICCPALVQRRTVRTYCVHPAVTGQCHGCTSTAFPSRSLKTFPTLPYRSALPTKAAHPHCPNNPDSIPHTTLYNSPHPPRARLPQQCVTCAHPYFSIAPPQAPAVVALAGTLEPIEQTFTVTMTPRLPPTRRSPASAPEAAPITAVAVAPQPKVLPLVGEHEIRQRVTSWPKVSCRGEVG